MGFFSVKFCHFRNLEDHEIFLNDSKDIFLVGKNGQGKTNFLESLYYLCCGTSFRTRNDKKLVRVGEDNFSVSGVFHDDNGENWNVHSSFKKDKKEIYINGEKLSDRKELIRFFPCVIFAHEDFFFVKGEPENQRFFFDQTSVLLDLLFLDYLRNYKKALKNRNILLSHRENSLEIKVWEEKLAGFGLDIVKTRQKLIIEVSAKLEEFFQKIFGSNLKLELCYKPSWKQLDLESVKKELSEKRGQDFSLGFTSSGPHRDRFVFFLNGKNVQETASTGQIRLISLLLRVIQAKLTLEKTGKSPILLLDDVLLELDREKKEAFFKELPLQSQVISTFLPGEKVISTEKALVLDICEGKVG